MDKRRRKRRKRIRISYFNIFCYLVIMVNIVVTALFIIRPILENSVIMAELNPNCDVHKVYLYSVHDIHKISAEEYEYLSYKERINFLINVMADAGVKLGLSGEITTIVKDLEEDHIYGYYSTLSDAIFFDKQLIENGTLNDCVNTALHELNHLYFHRVYNCLDKLDADEKKLLYFQYANDLSENIKNYVDTEDLKGYYNQPLEVEARQFASKQAYNYIKDEN